MAITPGESGFLLLDEAMNPLASNTEAIQILSFPSKPDRIRQLNVFLADRIRTVIGNHQAPNGSDYVKEYQSGRRRYVCRGFRISWHSRNGTQPAVALLLERNTTSSLVLEEIAKQFDLTQRERETVELLLQGLTSKEIATRMAISPNTVKAFLRLVMVKMGVSTRSGIVGRIAGSM